MSIFEKTNAWMKILVVFNDNNCDGDDDNDDDNGNDKFIFEQLYSAFFICPVVLCNENRF